MGKFTDDILKTFIIYKWTCTYYLPLFFLRTANISYFIFWRRRVQISKDE